MTSWRDQTSAETQSDLDGLLDTALDLAQQELAAHGEFYPFAVALGLDGQQSLLAPAAKTPDDRPSSVDLILTCQTKLREQRHRFRAAAVVSDVHVSALRTDAIDVAVEHVEGVVMRVLLPYERQRLRRTVKYGELRAQSSTPYIWRSATPG